MSAGTGFCGWAIGFHQLEIHLGKPRKELWNGEYASVNHMEYYAEGVQSYFNTGNRSIQDDQTLMKGLIVLTYSSNFTP